MSGRNCCKNWTCNLHVIDFNQKNVNTTWKQNRSLLPARNLQHPKIFNLLKDATNTNMQAANETSTLIPNPDVIVKSSFISAGAKTSVVAAIILILGAICSIVTIFRPMATLQLMNFDIEAKTFLQFIMIQEPSYMIGVAICIFFAPTLCSLIAAIAIVSSAARSCHICSAIFILAATFISGITYSVWFSNLLKDRSLIHAALGNGIITYYLSLGLFITGSVVMFSTGCCNSGDLSFDRTVIVKTQKLIPVQVWLIYDFQLFSWEHYKIHYVA